MQILDSDSLHKASQDEPLHERSDYRASRKRNVPFTTMPVLRQNDDNLIKQDLASRPVTLLKAKDSSTQESHVPDFSSLARQLGFLCRCLFAKTCKARSLRGGNAGAGTFWVPILRFSPAVPQPWRTPSWPRRRSPRHGTSEPAGNARRAERDPISRRVGARRARLDTSSALRGWRQCLDTRRGCRSLARSLS